jgi:hypothetical protein
MTRRAEITSDDPAATAGAGLPEHYFELYQLAVEMADRVSARRGTANAFFLSINTALLAVVGSTDPRWSVAVAGIVFSGAWWLLLRSYRRLNAAKFSVILEMEQLLPKQVFSDEYRHYRNAASLAGWTARYRELGEVERVVPVIFGFMYAVELVLQVT